WRLAVERDGDRRGDPSVTPAAVGQRRRASEADRDDVSGSGLAGNAGRITHPPGNVATYSAGSGYSSPAATARGMRSQNSEITADINEQTARRQSAGPEQGPAPFTDAV